MSDPHRFLADVDLSHHVFALKGSLSVRCPFADCSLVSVSAFKGSDCRSTGDWVASSSLLVTGVIGSVGGRELVVFTLVARGDVVLGNSPGTLSFWWLEIFPSTAAAVVACRFFCSLATEPGQITHR